MTPATGAVMARENDDPKRPSAEATRPKDFWSMAAFVLSLAALIWAGGGSDSTKDAQIRNLNASTLEIKARLDRVEAGKADKADIENLRTDVRALGDKFDKRFDDLNAYLRDGRKLQGKNQ